MPSTLPPSAYAAALASVPTIGPASLRALLAGSAPRQAWEAVLGGRTAPAPRAGRWAAEARRLDVAEVWRAHEEAGISVVLRGQPGYPQSLAADPEAPAVLFALGDPAVVDRHPAVAIVGTRSSTRYGLGVAAELGAGLAAAGVAVVSGLALGIDGAAHEGALAGWNEKEKAPRQTDSGAAPRPPRARAPGGAPPVGVVAGSPSSPYPRQHAGLWRRVAAAGAVLSEAPVGTTDLGWRFPMRNRIIAGLADVVVVVECHAKGGALHTVRAANRRGIAVGAVPGSVRSPASSGANGLIADGCFVVRDVDDVLVAVGLARASAPLKPRYERAPSSAVGPGGGIWRQPQPGGWTPAPPEREGESERSEGTASAGAVTRPTGAVTRPTGGVARQVALVAGTAIAEAPPRPSTEAVRPTTVVHVVLEALGWERCSLDQVIRRTGLPLHWTAAALERLRVAGSVRGEAGWWERA